MHGFVVVGWVSLCSTQPTFYPVVSGLEIAIAVLNGKIPLNPPFSKGEAEIPPFEKGGLGGIFFTRKQHFTGCNF